MQTNEVLSYFANIIEKELGIVYAEHNYFQLQNRLTEISKQLGAASIEDLYTQAQKGIDLAFRQLLMDSATNNETSFFRDLKIFNAIEKTVFPSFVAQYSGYEKLSIWSAASSTGQEAYSTAISLCEWNAKSDKKINFDIVATDISERVLAKAKQGRYSNLEVERGLSPELRQKYFTHEANGFWQIKPEIQKHISFKKLNLKEPFGFSQSFHLVLCRNVLIYQSIHGKKDILNRMTQLLAPDGHLILGAGESLISLSEDYEQKQIEGAIVYKKKQKTSLAA